MGLLTFEIFLDTINVINVKVWMMILLIEHYLVIPLPVTLTIFQDHSGGGFGGFVLSCKFFEECSTIYSPPVLSSGD